MPIKSFEKRNQTIYQLVAVKRNTLAVVAEKFNLSVPRVCNITRTIEKRLGKERPHRNNFQSKRNSEIHHQVAVKRKSLTVVAEKFGLSKQRVCQIVQREEQDGGVERLYRSNRLFDRNEEIYKLVNFSGRSCAEV